MRHIILAVTIGSLAFVGIAQTGVQPSDRRITITCYWSSYQAHFFASFLPGTTITGLQRDACGEYKDPTHCERTVWEMIQQTTAKRFWLKVEGNGLIYTMNSSSCSARKKKKCKRFPSPGESYDAVADNQSITIRFEMPNNKDLIETFDIVDIAPMKEDGAIKDSTAGQQP